MNPLGEGATPLGGSADHAATADRTWTDADDMAAEVDGGIGGEGRTVAEQPDTAMPELPKVAEGQTEPHRIEATLRRLAALPQFDYAKQKKAAAKELGVTIGDLDDEIKRRRGRADVYLQGSPLEFREPEPWAEEVDGPDLLSEIATTIRRFVVLSAYEARAVALWVIHTYTFDLRSCSPLLVLTSPTKRCGKTTALETIGSMVRRPLATSSISPAALFRVIESHHPTLLIDEYDTFFSANEALRGIVNSGHRKGSAHVIRCVGEDHEAKAFSTWAPKLLAGIGGLPDTVVDRSIVIELRRKLSSELVERGAGLFDGSTIRSKIARWVRDHRTTIANADPELPSALHDRAQDNWRPLFAIAEAAGGEWPRHVREAAMSLAARDAEDGSTGVLLLADIKEYFAGTGVTKASTETLVEHLTALEERPWHDYRNGKPITAALLSRRMTEFGVTSKTIRIGADTKKGFERRQFEDAWQRYLPESGNAGLKNVTPSQPNAHAAPGREWTHDTAVAVTLPKRNADQAVPHSDGQERAPGMGCDGVTDLGPTNIGTDQRGIPRPEPDTLEIEI